MADLSALGGLQEVQLLDLTEGIYADAKESTFRLPVKGRYTVQAPDSFPSTAFGRTKKGALSIQVDPKIIGPTNEGFQLRFTKLYNTTYERQGKPVSSIGDYLRACGWSGILRTEQDMADAVESTANKTYQVEIDWKAYGKSGFEVKGMEKFPKLADGSHQSWIEDPTDLDPETGKPIRLRANIEVKKYLAATN